MTATAWQLMLYAGGMAALWAVPGPVWLALKARALSGGVGAVSPLVVGVALGDAVWPVAAILGLNAAGSVLGDALGMLEWVEAGIFVVMGVQLIRRPAADLVADGRLTRPGVWAGFAAVLVAVGVLIPLV